MSEGLRILYVEDDPGLSRLVRTKLQADGYQVDIAATGREGLATFDESLHDLVIVDYQLPDGNGLQVLEALAARRAGVPVIIATGAGSEEIAVQAMKLGAADYINKESYERFFHLLPSVIEKAMRQQVLESQKQRAETEMRESEERLRSILSSIDDAVLVTDKVGLFVAARAPGASGRTVTASAEWVGVTFRDVFPPEVASLFEAAFAAVQGNDRVEQFDYCLPSGGSAVWFNAKVSPLKDVHRAFAGVTIVARDITERKRTEDQLRLATQAADAASRAKSELLAGMSHELRTPLTAIIGYAEILLYEYFGAVKETASRRKIRIENRSVPGLAAVELAADARRIKQVVFNLLSNALKFTPEGGSIEVALGRLEGSLSVCVTDTGIGIPAGELERIFDAFYQVKGRPSSSKAQGSGLGLSLARQIVALHGGRIWAASDGEGKGSRLTFTLPLNRPAG